METKKVTDLTPDEARSTLQAILDAVLGANYAGSPSDALQEIERAFARVDIETELEPEASGEDVLDI